MHVEGPSTRVVPWFLHGVSCLSYQPWLRYALPAAFGCPDVKMLDLTPTTHEPLSDAKGYGQGEEW